MGAIKDILIRAEEGGWADQIRTKADERAVFDGCYYDSRAAQHVVDFFQNWLVLSKGQWAGQPFVLMSWEVDVLSQLFGWKREDGTRRYRMASLWVAKKNGKSALLSGISLYLLVADGEGGAEVYSAAADRAQASIIYNEAANMVEVSPVLRKRLQVIRSTKRILDRSTRSVFHALSADAYRQEGLNASGMLFDELHSQPNRDLFDTLRYAGAARQQSLFLSISTAGYDRHSIGYEQYDYAKKVLSGVIDDYSYFAYIAEVDKDVDWTDEANWQKANPSWGVTIDPVEFKASFQEARESPARQNAFRRYRLNQWTEQAVRWLEVESWDANEEAYRLESLEGRECYAGLDMASTRDLTALVLVFPEDEGGYKVWPWYWVPTEGARIRSRRDRVPYDTWIADGYITATPGNVTDYDRVRADIVEISQRFDILELAIDRWNSTQLQEQLSGEGLNIVQFGQGFKSMSAPTKELERLVLNGTLRHTGHPVLRWNIANVVVKIDAAENFKPDKEKATDRIDGMVAMIMAIGRAMVSPSVSIYEDAGL